MNDFDDDEGDEIDRLIDEAMSELDEAERAKLAAYINAGLQADMVIAGAAATSEAYDDLMRGLSRPH